LSKLAVFFLSVLWLALPAAPVLPRSGTPVPVGIVSVNGIPEYDLAEKGIKEVLTQQIPGVEFTVLYIPAPERGKNGPDNVTGTVLAPLLAKKPVLIID